MSEPTQRIVESVHTVAEHASFLGWITGLLTLCITVIAGFFKTRFTRIDKRLNDLDVKTNELDKTVSKHETKIEEIRKQCGEHRAQIAKRDEEFNSMVVRLHDRIDETNTLIRQHGESIAANGAILETILHEVRHGN